MNIRELFSQRFGEEQAKAIEDAAASHGNGINDLNIGEPFKHALLICIGYQCFEVPRYRKHHGITPPFKTLKDWIKANAELHTYTGDLDYLGLLAGAYNDYMPSKQDA